MMDVALLTCLLAGHTADLTTTEIALRRPHAVEGNILLKNRGVRISVNVGATVAEYQWLHRKSRKTKFIACGALLAARTAVSVRNLRGGEQ